MRGSRRCLAVLDHRQEAVPETRLISVEPKAGYAADLKKSKHNYTTSSGASVLVFEAIPRG